MARPQNFVFLDRDGVIIKEVNHISKVEDVEILPRVVEAIKLLNDNNYKVIVISNQSAVARGYCTEERVHEINGKINELLNEAKIDANYFCPHHPEKGDNPFYRKNCECRKPKPGMIFQAQKDNNIEYLKNCWLIGDKTGDILCGNRAGCKTILVKTGYGGNDNAYPEAKPDLVANDLYDAVQKILNTT